MEQITPTPRMTENKKASLWEAFFVMDDVEREKRKDLFISESRSSKTKRPVPGRLVYRAYVARIVHGISEANPLIHIKFTRITTTLVATLKFLPRCVRTLSWSRRGRGECVR